MDNLLNLLKSDYITISKLLFQAKRQVVISTPNISIEIAKSLVEIKSRGIDVNIFLEISENTYRNGYGDIKAIEILHNANINIQNKNGLNIDDRAFTILKSMIEDDGNNQLYYLKTLSGEILQTSGGNFNISLEEYTAKERAYWKKALQDLIDNNIIFPICS